MSIQFDIPIIALNMQQIEENYNQEEYTKLLKSKEECLDQIYIEKTATERLGNFTEPSWPVPEHTLILSSYGWRFENQNFHEGISITDDTIYGASVVAIDNGVVLEIVEDLQGLMGLAIVVDHGNGISSLYQNLSETQVVKGERIEKGQAIGKVGNTGKVNGAVLEFEIRENGKAVNPFTVLK